MNWLIVEDALRDRKGHWFEYVATFATELRGIGDNVTILADRAAEPFLVEQLNVQRVLPPSIWHRMSDGAGMLRRYLRVPVHAWRTHHAMTDYLAGSNDFDVIFVPTVLVHHLLGWTWLIKRTLKNTRSRVLLFFPNTPIQLDPKTDEPSWHRAPTAKLFRRLIWSLRAEANEGRVILGAETGPMCEALTRLTSVRFTYFPHPVAPISNVRQSDPGPEHLPTITMGSYGSARHEKGSDVLVNAVSEYCRRFPDSPSRFVLQNVNGDEKLWARLNGNPHVQIIPNYFKNGEYVRQLAKTDVLLLPYRRPSYGLRVSRVVIEAMVYGIPVVATRRTTLEEQAKQFGAAAGCDDGSAESLIQAIQNTEHHLQKLTELAQAQKAKAIEHFSVRTFRRILLDQPCGQVARPA